MIETAQTWQTSVSNEAIVETDKATIQVSEHLISGAVDVHIEPRVEEEQ